MARAPEQVECAGSESSLRSWGASGRHVEPGPLDGVRMMREEAGFSAPPKIPKIPKYIPLNRRETPEAFASTVGGWRVTFPPQGSGTG